MGRQHPHIPEEDEEAEEGASNVAVNQEQPPSSIQQRLDLADADAIPIHDSTDMPTATESNFPVETSSAAPQQPAIVSTPIDSTTLSSPKSTALQSLDLMTQQSNSPSQSSGLPAQSRISPGPFSTPTSTLVGQQDASVTSTSAASEGDKKIDQKRHPSDWSVEEVVEWLNSKGFGQDVSEKFIGAFI